jgi:N-acetylneuraminate synthase/N,N'-diacetyllegionaminate synthase
MKRLSIGGRSIDTQSPTLVIAEIGVNHDGSLDRALELVQIAADCGADAVKLQIFSADVLMHDSSQFAGYQAQRCDETSATEMLRRYQLDRSAVTKIADAIRECRIMPIATPFSVDDLQVIRELNLPAIKIASPDLVNRVLLKAAAECDSTMLLSTGAATIDEVHGSVQFLKQLDARFALLHCVSAYPTPMEDAHLGWIGGLAKFGVPVGFSDHTTETLAGSLAVTSGACVIEKHLTYDRRASGPDHAASADPEQFAQYVRMIRFAEKMRGVGGKCILPIERDVRNVSRQSLVLRRDVQPGESISESDVIVQRPGTGISAADFSAAIGRRARQPLKAGTLLQWDMLTDAA